MSQTATLSSEAGSAPTEHFDVVVVGAGISGVGGLYHLRTQRPELSIVAFDKFESFGGTWHWHKYPGVRSDSDLYTFGYRFKPWEGPPIATAQEILNYMGEVIEDNDLGQHIRYRHKIEHAAFSNETNRWTLHVRNLSNDTVQVVTCTFLWMCQGYYKFEEGYTPEWPGMKDFKGQIIHPQTWPEDLDYAGKRVVVIGSGATTATVVPAIAGDCAHVTVLQRSPTYFWTGRNVDELADTLRQLDVDPAWIHEIVRRKRLFDQQAVTQLSFEAPDLVRDELLRLVQEELPEGYDMKHFTPKYRPWQQRLAFVPDADLFAGIRAGKASMVTDEVETFNETGILTKGGEQLDADIIITATGFNLSVLGDIPFEVDGAPVHWPETVTYRGMMFTGVPNMLWVFGYFRASWTLRADLISDFVCRLLGYMHEHGYTKVVPAIREVEDAEMTIGPWMDPDNFNPGYLMRSMHLLPQKGDKPEWQHSQDYWVEKESLPRASLEDGCLRYS
ncbi:MAG: flavin-containing monooxygenase [Ilumatobacteraceae bacterium]